MIFYSHIESYEHLNWYHIESERNIGFFDTVEGACNLGKSSLDLCLFHP